mgnify:CR=1 FL=1
MPGDMPDDVLAAIDVIGNNVRTEILRRLMLNQYKSHGKLGVIVSGEPNIGKTTTVAHIARRFERRRRDVGRAGGGVLTIADRGAVTNPTAILGTSAGAVGTVTVTGNGSTWTNNGALTVGGGGAGALTITDGGAVSTTVANVASAGGSSGSGA